MMNFNISTRPHISRGVSDIFTRPGPLGMNLGVTGMGHEEKAQRPSRAAGFGSVSRPLLKHPGAAA